MSRYQLDEKEEAHRQLESVKAELARVESLIDEGGFPPIGTWFSWAMVRILEREASAMLGI